jgi:hypothetical protein
MKRFWPRLSCGWIGAALAATALYGWILSSTHGLGPISGRQPDYFNLLGHGFLKGQLSLDTPVPPDLLKLANPYDPAQRPAGLALHDASLYHGKYYIYFGPTALVVLMLPFAALTGNDLPIGCAVGCFVLVGFLAQLATFLRYRRQHFPASSRWTAAAAVLALATCGFQLTLLARHTMYELPIACGACFFWWALYGLIRAAEFPPAPTFSLLAGLALGLAIASRPVYLVATPLLALPFWRPRGLRPALLGAAGCAAILAPLLWYNHARFDRWLEFGQNYQLSGAIEGAVRHFGFGNLPFNFRVYFLSAFEWGRYFPFIHFPPQPPLPAGFGGYEAAFGILFNFPFYLFGLAGLVWIGRRTGRKPAGPPRRLVLLPVALTGLILSLLLCGFFGCVVRYEHDFAPAVLLLACFGLLEWEAIAAQPWRRIAVRVSAWFLAGGSAGVAFLAALVLYRQFAIVAPHRYEMVGRVLDWPVAVLERLHAHPDSGALRLRVVFPVRSDAAAPHLEPLVSTGWPGQRDGIWVEYSDSNSVRFLFFHGVDQPLAVSPSFSVAPGAEQRITISLGSLYPPGAPAAQVAQVYVALEGQPAWQFSAECFESTPGTVALGEERGDSRRFSGRILASERWILPLAAAPFASRHLRLALSLQPQWAGRSFPLLTAGRTDMADLLFVRILDGTHIQFGYDHWGRPVTLSPPLNWPMNERQELEIQFPPAGPDLAPVSLTVASGNRVLWRAAVRSYPAQPYELFPLANPVGATSCEFTCPGAKLASDGNLPSPATPGW